MRINKNKEEEQYKKYIIDNKNKYELRIREILNNKKEHNYELNLKNEQLRIMKLNYDKIIQLHQRKIEYYENEIKKYREKYNILLKQGENSEIKMNNSNRSNTSNSFNNKKINNKDIKFSNDLNDFMDYIQDNLMKQHEENKLMMSKIIQDKEKDIVDEKELYENYKKLKQDNEDLNIKINVNENKINLLQEQLNELNEYKNVIKTMNKFICKNCFKSFKIKDFISHIKQCKSNINNVINEEKNNFLDNRPLFEPKQLEIKIIREQIKKDELNHLYIEYIIDINYDNKKKYQLNKQFYQFYHLYNNMVNINKGNIQFSFSFSDIFQNLNSDFSFNQKKTKVLEKFINEISHNDILNNSKSFLKFIEYNKYLDKIVRLEAGNNSINWKKKEPNNIFNYEENNYEKMEKKPTF